MNMVRAFQLQILMVSNARSAAPCSAIVGTVEALTSFQDLSVDYFSLEVFPGQCTALINAPQLEYSPLTFKLTNIVNKKDLEATLLEIANSKASNYRAIARKHNIILLILNYYI
jgi:hypothetical protein